MEPCKETKKFNNASDLFRTDDAQFNRELEKQLRDREIVTTLFALRMARGVSQGEVAKHLHCSQSRISKIENGTDGDLRVGELAAYLKAMDCASDLVIKRRNETIADEVKRHALRIRELLARLAELSHKDEVIAEGAAAFLGEAFFNLVKIIADSAEKMPERPDGKPHIEILIQDDRAGDLSRARRRVAAKSPAEATPAVNPNRPKGAKPSRRGGAKAALR